MEEVLKVIDQVMAFITGGTGLVLLPIVWELVGRFLPTVKPAGFLHTVGGLLVKLGTLLDKIAPQQLK